MNESVKNKILKYSLNERIKYALELRKVQMKQRIKKKLTFHKYYQ